MDASVKPATATDIRVNLLGLLGLCTGAWWFVHERAPDAFSVPLLLLLTAGPILLLDVLVNRVHHRPSTGLDWAAPHERDAARVVTKWIGAAAGASIVALGYLCYPEYQWPLHLFASQPYTGFYASYYGFLNYFGPALLLVGGATLAWLDVYLIDPRDPHWHLGALILGQRKDVDYRKAADLLRMWIIGGYFLPLMFVYATGNLTNLHTAVHATRPTFDYWFEVLYSLGLLVDVMFAVVGLVTISRVFDNHLRTADDTGPGWITTLVFYQPFLSVFSRQYFAYESHLRWGDWLFLYPETKVAWGTAILVCVWAAALSAVAFGCRFSNLTNRGILTGWTYAWTKHPMYVANVGFLALTATPFLHEGSTIDVFRRMCMFSLFAGLYWVRGRMEERHLSADPAYVQYALYMNRRSLFAPLGALFPFLRYAPPPQAAQPAPPH
jgi:protein-S-isoprenylcysteine O-methyltransferase Ste14